MLAGAAGGVLNLMVQWSDLVKLKKVFCSSKNTNFPKTKDFFNFHQFQVDKLFFFSCFKCLLRWSLISLKYLNYQRLNFCMKFDLGRWWIFIFQTVTLKPYRERKKSTDIK